MTLRSSSKFVQKCLVEEKLNLCLRVLVHTQHGGRERARGGRTDQGYQD